MLLVAAAIYLFNPTEYSFMPKCIFKSLTGFSCPGCGFQRSLHAFLHGDFASAIRYNYFFLIAMPYLFSVVMSDVILRGEARRRWQRFTHSRWVLLGFVILTMAWWIVRNITGL